MAQAYYTLQEASSYLDMPVDELKQLAQKGQIRSFQDRGSLRFRSQDVEELLRQRGGKSEPDLVLGDASTAAPKSAATPPSGAKKAPALPKTSVAREDAPEVFEFVFDADHIDLGADLISPKSGSKGQSGPKSAKQPARPSVPPAGSDSDVRLVADGSDVTFSLHKDSDIKLVDSQVKVTHDSGKVKSSPLQPSSGPKRPSQLALDSAVKPAGTPSSAAKRVSPKPGAMPQPVDSGVRLVPMDSDSDVNLVGASVDMPLGESTKPSATDSNDRLDLVKQPPADSGEGGLHLTEEINLDEEIQKEQAKQRPLPPTMMKAKSALKLPTHSPFELSDDDLKLPAEQEEDSGPRTPVTSQSPPADSSDFELASQSSSPQEGSSDFELTPQGSPRDSSSDFDLVPANDGTVLTENDSNDFSLEASANNEQVLAEQGTELTSSTSGISLDNLADEGVSLEDDGNSDFDLSLEVEDTPRPGVSQPAEDSQGDFELSSESAPKSTKLGAEAAPDESEDDFDLSLDSDSTDAPLPDSELDSDSNFELNLKGSAEGDIANSAESDSEFELTLDDSGNIAAAGDEDAAPQVKAKTKQAKSSEDQDIFEAEFEVPALDESDDATVADSELESSDFDLALDDSELAQDEESGSQVVALDEEEDEVETVAESDSEDAVVDDVEEEEESSDFADLDADVQVEDDAVVEAEEEEESEKEIVVKDRLIEPAPWGVMPVIFMLPCVIIMFLVGILGYEFLQSASGPRPPGPLTVAIGEMIGQPVVKK